MPQLHCYVNDQLAEKVQQQADQAHLSVSKYISLLIMRDVGSDWPKGYFALFGQWQGDSLERAPQGGYEARASFD